MDCRISILAVLSVGLGSGCVTTQSNNQAPPAFADLPANAVVQKPKDGPKRPPLPGTVVAVAIMREREAEKSKDASEKLKCYDEARKCYQEALKIDPKYRDAVQGLARVYVQMEDYPHAFEIYQKALDINAKDHGLWFDLGMCYNRNKELTKGLPCFQKALDLDPENRQYMTYLGLTLARTGQTEKALTYLSRAMGPAMAHYNLARMLEHVGQIELCQQHLQLALQINPNLDQAREMLSGMPGQATFVMQPVQ